MAKYSATIGLEVHVQLGTRTKMFCSCETRWNAAPNSLVCPVCLGLPGALPVLNEKALELGIRAACAFGASVAERTKFDRKNYFYPDLPKGYQISQHDKPLASGGAVEYALDVRPRRIELIRLHLEEDAGKLMHEKIFSIVDLNRCGVPLLEIVSTPTIESPEDASAYLTAMREILRYAGISECNMEQGNLRIDTNISIRPEGVEKFGTRTEIKNINSFRNVEAALRFEIARQTKVLDAGEKVVQETLNFNAETGETKSMRSKEEAHDYRYFPEPDLIPFIINKEDVKRIRVEMPELPKQLRERLQKEYGLSEYDAVVLVSERDIAIYFIEMVKSGANPKGSVILLKNFVKTILNEKKSTIKEFEKGYPPGCWVPFVDKIANKEFTQEINRKIFSTATASFNPKIFEQMKYYSNMSANAESIAKIITQNEFVKISDKDEISKMLEDAIAANEKAVADLKKGKLKAKDAIIGFVMRKTRGKADPEVLNKLLREKFPDVNFGE
jgi:aspartyl-tRNA(Asn)/glutamyl-tRNA(Gln) amidotransferase subunit B